MGGALLRPVALVGIALLAIAASLPVHAEDGAWDAAGRRVLVFYDRTQPANLLWPYSLRVLVVEDLEGSGECFENLPNGTALLRCKPLKAKVTVEYAELREYADSETDELGVASTSWRLVTFPKATFRVRAMLEDGVAEAVFRLDVKPWPLASLIAFACMVAALALVAKRGSW